MCVGGEFVKKKINCKPLTRARRSCTHTPTPPILSYVPPLTPHSTTALTHKNIIWFFFWFLFFSFFFFSLVSFIYTVAASSWAFAPQSEALPPHLPPPRQKKKMAKISHSRQFFVFLPPQNCIFPPRCPPTKKKKKSGAATVYLLFVPRQAYVNTSTRQLYITRRRMLTLNSIRYSTLPLVRGGGVKSMANYQKLINYANMQISMTG